MFDGIDGASCVDSIKGELCVDIALCDNSKRGTNMEATVFLKGFLIKKI